MSRSCKSRWSLRAFLPGVFGSLALVCLAQEASAPTSQEPVTTFQSTTRLVILDVVVTDKQGNPVRTLSKDDFTILEDGQVQTISSFEAPDQHAPVSISGEAKNASAIPGSGPPKIGAQPLTILVFDALDTQILDQAYARYEINKFLKAHGPHLSQPTAMMALEEKRIELLHDYTKDAKELEQALHAHRPHLPFRLMRSVGSESHGYLADRNDAMERLVDAILALREIAAANVQFAGRKNVIWIGPGFPSLAWGAQSTAAGDVVPVDDFQAWNGVGFRGLDEMKADPSHKITLQSWEQETLEMMWRARMSVYTIDPRGLEVFPEEIMTPPTGALAFEQIAPLTGGRIIRDANDIDARIAKSMDEGGAYYSLAYSPLNRDWNGKFRRVRVLTKDAKLNASTRKGYYALLDAAPNSQELDRLLSLAVLNPLSYHSLQLQARAKVSGKQPRVAHVALNLETKDLHWESPEAGKRRCEITVVAVGFSAKAEPVTHAVKEFQIDVDDKKYFQLLKKGMLMELAVQLPSAVVRMRVVVRDSTNGNLGTADLTPEGEQFH